MKRSPSPKRKSVKRRIYKNSKVHKKATKSPRKVIGKGKKIIKERENKTNDIKLVADLKAIIQSLLIRNKTLEEGHVARNEIVHSIIAKIGNKDTENVTNTDIKTMMDLTISYFDKHLFQGKLRESSIIDKNSVYNHTMWHVSQIPYMTGNVFFKDKEALIKHYSQINKFPKNKIQGYSSFIHFIVNTTEHEITHGLVKVYNPEENRFHSKLFWDIFKAFTGTQMHEYLINMYLSPEKLKHQRDFYLKFFNENFAEISENEINNIFQISDTLSGD